MTSIQADLIAEGLVRLGLTRGGIVFLHSSLSSLGHVEGGADAVIDAFLAVLGPWGTLAAPVFTYGFAGEGGKPLFEPETSPGVTGQIPEALRRRPGARRSLHPTHSMAALGPEADALVRNHLESTPLGRNSPLHRIGLRDGWIVLVGCGHDSNSIIHTAEILSGMPYVGIFCWLHLGWQPQARFVDPTGRVRTLAIYECPGCSRSFGRIEPELRARGLLREGMIGPARAQVVRARDVLNTVAELLQADSVFLLCPQGSCRACDVRRSAVRLPQPPPLPGPSEWITL
ncbi:MAG: AAC(3) family N-acetyltransferase [Planctomycetes bacterium]|nr:AAC(3) family N-acetyltransferase [Planctomycetota bacterium]